VSRQQPQSRRTPSHAIPVSCAGSFQPPNDATIPELEPNNKFGGEFCLAANYSQGYGVPFGWAYTDLRCNSTLVPLCKIRPAGSVPLVFYKSNATLSTFALASDLVNASVAEAACNKLGAHLATFASEAEQYEVEQVCVRVCVCVCVCGGGRQGASLLSPS
jgi:hypothetical protein